MKRRFASLLLALALCLSLTIPAGAADQVITVGDETFEHLLQAMLSQEEDQPMTVTLGSDVTLTATVVVGSSDYDGMFPEAQTVASHDVTIDLNGHTLTGPAGAAALEVQAGYTLTIADSSEAKTGALASDAEEAVVVAEGGTYNALPAAGEETPAEETPAEETVTNPFTDVPESAYYYAPVQWAVAQGITTGRTETTFAPGENCTRANIVTFLWRAAGSPEPTLTEQQYMDVADPGAYYYKAVQWAAEKDMEGSGTFRPNDPCTRLEAVYFLWRAADSPEMAGQLPFTDVPFGDGDENGQPLYWYADQAVLWAVENGVTTGKTETTFAPSEICTRGHIVTFLYRAANYQAAETAE